MVPEKTALSLDELEAQYAAELPDREMLGLVTIIIAGVLNGINISIPIDVKNNNVAVQVCAVVQALATATSADLTCTIQQ